MTHVGCEFKDRPVEMLAMHPFTGNWLAIGCAVVYHAWGEQAFSAGIK